MQRDQRLNGCLPKHEEPEIEEFLVTHPMTDHCESCLTSTIAAERANHLSHPAPQKLYPLENADEMNLVFGVNQFSDLSDEEFKAIYLNYLPSEKSPCSQISTNYSGILLPDNLDWRQKNVVTRVKSQESCGACWAFAAVGNIESMNAIKNGQLLEFSEQQLVDCTSDKFDCRHGGIADTGIILLMSLLLGAQTFPMDGIGRLGQDPPRGLSADWWVLTTADAAGTNGLTCLPKYEGARDSNFWSPIQ
ncbi:hypothetical protein evm_014976 [Chilo suppressalis]|nr:hypothetical protein evm_014976 [Chilo suppressalis]